MEKRRYARLERLDSHKMANTRISTKQEVSPQSIALVFVRKVQKHLMTQEQVHMESTVTSTYPNDVKDSALLENTVQTAVRIRKPHDNRNARKRDADMSFEPIRLLSNGNNTADPSSGTIMSPIIDNARQVLAPRRHISSY